MNKNFLIKLLSGTCALTITLSLAPPALAMFPNGDLPSCQILLPPLFQNNQGTPANNNLNPAGKFGLSPISNLGFTQLPNQLQILPMQNANSFKSNSQKSKNEHDIYKENINVRGLEFKKKLCKLFFKNKQLGKNFIITIINNIISMLSNDKSGAFHDLVCREGKITREQLDNADIRPVNRDEQRKAYALFNHLAEDADVWFALFKAWLKLQMGN